MEVGSSVLLPVFCEFLNAGEGYVFLVDTANAEGEMRIADYHHDYMEALDWRPLSKVVFRSLSASTLHAARQIERGI